MLRHRFVSLCLNAGLSVGKQTEKTQVLKLLERLHPVHSGHPLIRIGNAADGTYLVPDDLEGLAACFSPGVNNRATFEEFFVERGLPCYLADASVDGPPIQSPLIHFEKKFLGTVDDADTLTMDRWVSDNAPGNDDLILQMDIEGAEWTVLLDSSPATLRRFRIVLLECHDLERLFDKHAFVVIKSMFDKVLASFDIIHSHPNNYGSYVKHGALTIPRSMEMTFIRKDRVTTRSYVTAFPHPLDIQNAPHLPDVPLPKEWFRSDRVIVDQI